MLSNTFVTVNTGFAGDAMFFCYYKHSILVKNQDKITHVQNKNTYHIFFICVGDQLVYLEVHVHTRFRRGCNRRITAKQTNKQKKNR